MIGLKAKNMNIDIYEEAKSPFGLLLGPRTSFLIRKYHNALQVLTSYTFKSVHKSKARYHAEDGLSGSLSEAVGRKKAKGRLY